MNITIIPNQFTNSAKILAMLCDLAEFCKTDAAFRISSVNEIILELVSAQTDPEIFRGNLSRSRDGLRFNIRFDGKLSEEECAGCIQEEVAVIKKMLSGPSRTLLLEGCLMRADVQAQKRILRIDRQGDCEIAGEAKSITL